MGFMLSEYDALPFGLLRNGEDAGQSPEIERATSSKFVHCCPPPGQKVMPLDKVRIMTIISFDGVSTELEDQTESAQSSTVVSGVHCLTVKRKFCEHQLWRTFDAESVGTFVRGRGCCITLPHIPSSPR